MNLTPEDVQNILRIIDSPYVELRLETAEFKLFVRKAGDSQSASVSPAPTLPPTMAASVDDGIEREPDRAARSAGAHAPNAIATPRSMSPRAERPLAPGESAIVAPMVGTFYRTPAPGAPPFVEVGDVVDVDSVVCIIEVMKLMNSIRAERRGRVVEILVDNAQPVQNDQAMMIIGTET